MQEKFPAEKKKVEASFEICARSLEYFDDWEMAHSKAHGEGGVDDICNLLPLCHGCNQSMGVGDFETFLRRQNRHSTGSAQKTLSKKQVHRVYRHYMDSFANPGLFRDPETGKPMQQTTININIAS